MIEWRAMVLRGASQTEIQRAQSADLQIGDGVEMVPADGQPQQSYAILSLPDLANVELFASTKMFFAGLKQNANGSAEVTLDLEAGAMFVHPNAESTVRVIVRTPEASVKSLTSDTEFDVCRSEELTCILVKQGVVEIAVQDTREILRAGSAMVVLNDQTLSSAICAPIQKFIAWEESYRLFSNAPTLQQEIAGLPQEPCAVSPSGFPWNARILFRDEFSSARGWVQGEVDPFAARYVRYLGGRYYQVEVQGAQDQFLSFVPNERIYGDVNIEIKTRIESASPGDFRYGMVFRRSGDQYYAFVISPPTEGWYFLKSSADGLKILRYGTEKKIRGLEGQDTLRVETYGSTFLLFINDQFIAWLSDADYASGEAGLFVDSMEITTGLINFNSITVWDMPAPVLSTVPGENCFNGVDDDGDGQTDLADPRCQRIDPVTPPATATPPPTRTPRATRTPKATRTPRPPDPTATQPPATQPPLPTLVPPLPTLVPPLPTLIPPLPTVIPPILTLLPPLPTIDLPLPVMPPAETPIPE